MGALSEHGVSVEVRAWIVGSKLKLMHSNWRFVKLLLVELLLQRHIVGVQSVGLGLLDTENCCKSLSGDSFPLDFW